MKEYRIAVCVPIHVSAQISVNFFINFINRLGELDTQKYHPIILFSTKSPIDRARNYLVSEALKHDATHIWFIDTDQVIPKGTLEALLDMDGDIVSPLYFEKGIPYWPCFRIWDKNGNYRRTNHIKWNDYMEIDGVGMGCSLIKAKVFKKVRKPWFKWVVKGGESVLGEDLYFCKKAKNAGFKILLNTHFVVGHHGGLVTEREYFAYKDLRRD